MYLRHGEAKFPFSLPLELDFGFPVLSAYDTIGLRKAGKRWIFGVKASGNLGVCRLWVIKSRKVRSSCILCGFFQFCLACMAFVVCLETQVWKEAWKRRPKRKPEAQRDVETKANGSWARGMITIRVRWVWHAYWGPNQALGASQGLCGIAIFSPWS